jgi:REP element-mobilizing transposase RayT
MYQGVVGRKSCMESNEIYFVTSSIHCWINLLNENKFKDVIIESMNYLSEKKAMDVFAFVIMPNHIHLIIRSFFNEGIEAPYSSFLKHTAHSFKKLLKDEMGHRLKYFTVKASNKQYAFWQRDSLAVQLFSPKVAFQKLDYIHHNPHSEKWNLASDTACYYYSSASFYEEGCSPFTFLRDLRDEF